MARYCGSFLRILITLMMNLCGDVLFAYPTPVDFSGNLSRWNISLDQPDVTWEVIVSSGHSQNAFDDLVQESAEIWNAVPGSYLRLNPVGATESAKVTIHFDETIAGGDTSAGYAEFDKVGSRGPEHCVIHIAAPIGSDWGGLEKTTLHELGHCIGLGHSVVAESVMSYSLDRNGYSLALDDEAAISRLYPADQSAPRKPPGCAMGDARRAPANVGWLNGLLALPLLFWLYRFLLASLGYRTYVDSHKSERKVPCHATTHQSTKSDC